MLRSVSRQTCVRLVAGGGWFGAFMLCERQREMAIAGRETIVAVAVVLRRVYFRVSLLPVKISPVTLLSWQTIGVVGSVGLTDKRLGAGNTVANTHRDLLRLAMQGIP